MRIPFNKVFKELPKKKLRILPKVFEVRSEDKKEMNGAVEVETGHIDLEPENTLFGVRWWDHKGKDLEGELNGNHIIITGIYPLTT